MKNKLNLLLLGFGLFIGQQLQAQAALLILIFGDDIASEKFHVSLDVGTSLANVQNTKGTLYPGLNVGLGAHYKLSEKVQLLGELKLKSGRTINDTEKLIPIPSYVDSLITEKNTKWKMNYVDVPIMVRYSINNNFHVASGPMVSFLYTADEITEYTAVDESEGYIERDVRTYLEPLQLAWCFDVSYSILSLRQGQGVDLRLRYNYGLSSTFTGSTGNRTDLYQFIVTVPFIKTRI